MITGYMPPAVMTTQYALFSRNSQRGFKANSKPLFEAVARAKSRIREAKSIDDIPPFTDIAMEYGKLAAMGIITSFVKGYDTTRKRRIRKNSIDLESLIKFDWNLQNTAAVAAFSREAFIMAGVQTDELRAVLFEEAKAVFASGGTYRDWADTFSLHGFEPDNPFHLRTNYDTAANSAYSAGQWEQINENKDVFPYLKYVTMQDDRVREEHWALHDLIYPVDDPFWDNYMPPNGWNCRCSVEQLMQSELPEDYSPMGPNTPVNVDPQFMNNPGKSNAIYSQAAEAISTNWKEAGLPKWSLYAPARAELIDTDHMNQQQLLALYSSILGDKYVLDVNSMPVFLDSTKANKFAGYSLKDLKGRFKYLNCIEDAIQSPHEAWLNPVSKRLYYMKRYDKNVVLIAEINQDNQIEYFNIMIGSDNLTNNTRQGVLIYH
jgi:SPP1 gp7 family putative phage head morphogenesis protein